VTGLGGMFSRKSEVPSDTNTPVGGWYLRSQQGWDLLALFAAAPQDQVEKIGMQTPKVGWLTATPVVRTDLASGSRGIALRRERVVRSRPAPG
jgi:hypothetical protein